MCSHALPRPAQALYYYSERVGDEVPTQVAAPEPVPRAGSAKRVRRGGEGGPGAGADGSSGTPTPTAGGRGGKGSGMLRRILLKVGRAQGVGLGAAGGGFRRGSECTSAGVGA